MKNKNETIKTKLSAMKRMWDILHPRWMSPDVIIYISEYEKQHPEKKMTRRLMRKLEREYYRSERTKAKQKK